ncbi:GNAT family N-acetyltransferase [Rhizobiales bacterium]|uniref:GNAT family N-acetyltransferase n=1 Tax=Hongsoonwoonella zoysiae TaxID=2821844 RepID=UPI0015618890|nr:GNAT family N-acetyltransferase [Hongsoonwoonella zoysiae]NRG17003.1 GNAT family N-acetyltransferase [Hongsoonwoonella zoysiae]
MDGISIRPFQRPDSEDVRALFILINRELAPSDRQDAFERYIELSLAAEVDRIEDYYGERQGSFWVVESGGQLAGFYGLEPAGSGEMELRRMYLAPKFRGSGLASRMISHAEDVVRDKGFGRLVLSTSELQPAALKFYEKAGYTLAREEVADAANNKTVGGGIRRYHFLKDLR